MGRFRETQRKQSEEMPLQQHPHSGHTSRSGARNRARAGAEEQQVMDQTGDHVCEFPRRTFSKYAELSHFAADCVQSSGCYWEFGR